MQLDFGANRSNQIMIGEGMGKPHAASDDARMIIHKRDTAGVMQVSYAGRLMERGASMAIIAARWEHGARDLGYAVFAPQDRFTEYFYADQWFNIMRVGEATTGRLKGWYCNITQPATIRADAIIYDDLLLDVWVRPDGSALVLDEAEFAAAALDVALRQAALAGLAEVLRWVQAHLGPFTELASGVEPWHETLE